MTMTTKAGAQGTVASVAVHAPRGVALSCKGWEQEAALRMLMNCADPEVVGGPEETTAAGNTGDRARDADGFSATLTVLRELAGDETLLVRAGHPEGPIRTRVAAPRVLIAAPGVAGSNQAARASWLNVGAQTGLPAAYEAFAAAARRYFGGTLAGRLVLAGGMGATGGALPLAATLNGAAFLGIEADLEQIKRRVKSGYCEVMVNDLDEALRILKNSVRKREPASVGLIGNCAAVIPALASRGIVPDLLVDCTSPHGSLDNYIPGGLTTGQARELRRADAEGHRRRSLDSLAAQVRGMVELKRLGSMIFEFRGGLTGVAGVPGASEISDFSAEYIEPLRSEGRTPLLWVALSGEPADIARVDRLALEIFSTDEAATRWIRLAGKHVEFQGLPARVCLVDRALRARFGLALNDLVAQGAVKAPLVIGCEDGGNGAHAPRTTGRGNERQTVTEPSPAGGAIEALLAGLSVRASVASWAAIDERGRQYSRDWRIPRLAIVADGTAEMARKIDGALGDDFPATSAADPRG